MKRSKMKDGIRFRLAKGMLFKSSGSWQVQNESEVAEDLLWAHNIRVLEDSVVKKSNILIQSFEKSKKCKNKIHDKSILKNFNKDRIGIICFSFCSQL